MIKFNDAPFVPCNDCANWESCQEEAYQQGARDFAEWLVRKKGYLNLLGNNSNKLLAEWQKEVKN